LLEFKQNRTFFKGLEVLIKVTHLIIIYSIIDFSEKSDEYFALINIELMKIHRGWK